MKEALFTLDVVFKEYGIRYMVTGTVALSILGLPAITEPGDIDVKILNPNTAQLEFLKRQQKLSGVKLEQDRYEDECYTFFICNVKVNALIYRDYKVPEKPDFLRINILERLKENRVIAHEIPVQRADGALKDKLGLGRTKDLRYGIDLINYISGGWHEIKQGAQG